MKRFQEFHAVIVSFFAQLSPRVIPLALFFFCFILITGWYNFVFFPLERLRMHEQAFQFFPEKVVHNQLVKEIELLQQQAAVLQEQAEKKDPFLKVTNICTACHVQLLLYQNDTTDRMMLKVVGQFNKIMKFLAYLSSHSNFLLHELVMTPVHAGSVELTVSVSVNSSSGLTVQQDDSWYVNLKDPFDQYRLIQGDSL